MKNLNISMKRCSIVAFVWCLTSSMTYAQMESTMNLSSEKDFTSAFSELGNSNEVTKLTIVNKAANGGNALTQNDFYLLNAMESLEELDLSQDEITNTLPNNTFQDNKTLKKILLPINLSSIGAGSFNNSVITAITIPQGVTNNDGIKGRFSNCQQLQSIEFQGDNPTYFSHDGVVYKWNDQSKTSSTLVLYPCGKTEETYTMVAGCTEVGGDSFFYNNKLKKLVLSSELTNILKDGAWRNMSALEAFEVPDDNACYFTVAEGILGEYARNGKSSYLAFCPPAYDKENITIDGTLVDSVGGNADIRHSINSKGYFFGGVLSLKKIEFTEGFKYIGNLAVRNAPEGSNGNLEEIRLPSTLTHVGNDAFCQRNKVTTVILRGTVPPICGNNAFYQVNPQNLYVPATSLDAYKEADMKGLGKNNINPFYNITMTQGTAESTIGSDIAAEGMTVTITAAEPEAGKIFDQWITTSNIEIDNINAETTTFVMGSEPVNVTATYKDTETTSVKVVEAEVLKVFPNPTSDMLYINNSDASQYAIYSITGTLVVQGRLTRQTIPVMHLNNGIYVIKTDKGQAYFVKGN